MKNRTPLIVAGAVVVVLALAGLAVALAGGGDDGDTDGVVAPDQTTEVTVGGDVEETRDVALADGAPLPPLDRAAPDAGIGAAVPVIEGSTFAGDALTIGGATDGPTLYVYLAHWCPACNTEVPELIELRNRDGVPEGMNVVAVSTGVDSTGPNFPPSQWLVDLGWPTEWPVLADSADSEAFIFNGGGGFPYLMVVDADGTLLARDSGTKSAEELAAFIQTALATAA